VVLRSMVVVSLAMGVGVAPAATVVRLRSQADVAGSHVRVCDVAWVRPTTPANTPLCRAVVARTPLPGQTLDLAVADIRTHLERTGLNMAGVVFSGPAQVSVRARSSDAPVADPPPPSPTVTASGPDPSPPPPAAPTRQADLQRIRREIEQFVLKHVGRPAQQLHVEVDLSAVSRYLRRRSLGSFQIQSSPTGSWIGQRSLVLVRYQDGQARERVHVSVKIGLYQDVVVMARTVAARAVIRPEDVSAQRLLLHEPVGTTFQRSDEVTGQRTVRALSQGTIVRVRDVAAIPLVFRGDAVTVLVHGPGFVVRCLGRAKEDGMRDRVIEVQRLDSRETFMARVVGPRRVEVRTNPTARPTGVVQLGPSRTASRSFGSRWARSTSRR